MIGSTSKERRGGEGCWRGMIWERVKGKEGKERGGECWRGMIRSASDERREGRVGEG